MMGKEYKVVLFDLDHTLWDYELNCREALDELYQHYQLLDRGIPDTLSFYEQFRKVNTELWDLYDRGLITNDVIRARRFSSILGHFGIADDNLCGELSDVYLHHCPRKSNLLPHTHDVLDYLSGKYELSIVTNGFEEIQQVKLSGGNLNKYFAHLVTSQRAGYRKPAAEIFQYALKAHSAEPHEAIMIGDNLVTDIGGATNASIDTIFFNPEKIDHDTDVHHEISCLSELKKIL